MAVHSTSQPIAAPDKRGRYQEVERQIVAVLEGEDNLVAQMATVAAMLSDYFEHFFWTGFYLVDPARPRELVIGPYQGTLGCLRIGFDRGVCGAAAASGDIQLVSDVSAFPDHIVCDPRSRSEVVVPVFDKGGALLAVLDVDAVEIGAFDAEDAEGLRSIVARVFASDAGA